MILSPQDSSLSIVSCPCFLPPKPRATIKSMDQKGPRLDIEVTPVTPHLSIKSSPLMTLSLDSTLGGETLFLHLYNGRTIPH